MFARVSLRPFARLPGFLLFVLRRWREDRCPQIAGSLTYTTLLALVPMFAIAVAILSSAPFFEDVMVQIKIFLLLNLLPEIAGTIITVYMEEFARNAGRLTTVGVLVLFVMAIALMFTIDRSLNAIWRVGHARPYWISVLGYTVLLVTGPVLIGLSMAFTTYMMTLSMGMAAVPPETGSVMIRLIPMSIAALAFFLLYRIVPHRPVSARHALIGGVTAALLFEVAKGLFASYVRHVPAAHVVYGTFALVPIFLIWIYVSWLVVLFGAELTASLEYWRDGKWSRAMTADSRFQAAMAVGRRLVEAQGEALSFERLRLDTGIPKGELEATLERLEEEGLVRGEGRRYSLARDPAEVSLGSLFEAVQRDRAG